MKTIGSAWAAARAPVLIIVLVTAAACGGNGGHGAGEDSALVRRGETLYAANCQVCHGVAATGEGRVGVAPSHGPSGHTWHHPDGQIVDIVLGRFTYPGRTMPSFEGRLSEEEVRAILAHLKTGWTAEERQYQAGISAAWEEQRR